MSRWLHKIAAILPRLEPLALAVAAPFLLFPTTRPRWTAVMLALLAAFYLLRLIAQREHWPPALSDLTLPKLTGLILGLGAYRAVAFSIHGRRSFLWGVAALALVGRDLTHGLLRFVYQMLLVDHARDAARLLGRALWLGNPCRAPEPSALSVAWTGVT